MLNSFSGNAIMAKAMAMYGKRVTQPQYMELLHKRSVAEIAAYLREETGYRSALQNVQPTTVHRGQLETLLRKEIFSRYLRLVHFDQSQRDSYYHYFVVKMEIEQILQMLRLLSIGSAESYITQYPEFFNRVTRLDLMALAHVRGFDELLAVLEGTPYQKLVAACRPPAGGRLDYTRCETTLMSYFYSRIEQVIDSSFRGRTLAQLHDIFQTRLELMNICAIYRMKQYFPGASPDEVRACVLPVWKRIPGKYLDEQIAAPTARDFLAAVANSPFARYVGSDDFEFIEYSSSGISYRMCRRYLRFATDAPTAFTAYMTLCETELANITTIIEGVRYGLAAEEIGRMLIL